MAPLSARVRLHVDLPVWTRFSAYGGLRGWKGYKRFISLSSLAVPLDDGFNWPMFFFLLLDNRGGVYVTDLILLCSIRKEVVTMKMGCK